MLQSFGSHQLVSHSLTRAISFLLNFFIPGTTICIPLERLDTSASNSPPHPSKVQIPHPQEGCVKFQGARDGSHMLVGCPVRCGDVKALKFK